MITVHSGYGMLVGGLADAEAGARIVREFANAMHRRQWERIARLVFLFVVPPMEIEVRPNAQPSKPLVTIRGLGVPEK
jgi:hypothetical protein